MGAPRLDAPQVVLVEIARPPDDTRRVLCKMHDVLTGAAADLHHVAGFAGEEFFQHRPDRLMVAMERRRVEPTVGLDRPAILAELHYKFRHDCLASDRCSLSGRCCLAALQDSSVLAENLFHYHLKRARNNAAKSPIGE